jgi:hypothetical protein
MSLPTIPQNFNSPIRARRDKMPTEREVSYFIEWAKQFSTVPFSVEPWEIGDEERYKEHILKHCREEAERLKNVPVIRELIEKASGKLLMPSEKSGIENLKRILEEGE